MMLLLKRAVNPDSKTLFELLSYLFIYFRELEWGRVIKKHPAFLEASAGQPPGQPELNWTKIGPKGLVPLSFWLNPISEATSRWGRIKKH